MNNEVFAYQTQEYAFSLREFGHPSFLPKARGWLLRRPIPESTYADAMGCYPVFSCANWNELEGDLKVLGEGLVCASIVTDAFGTFSLPDLETAFDRVIRFKSHFVIDLSKEPASFVSQHHRYYTKRALKTTSVDVVQDLDGFLNDWSHLYGCLVKRHQLKGIKAFSLESFSKLLKVPGLLILRATVGNTTVGAHLWLPQGAVLHSHLAAFSDEGYNCGAAYALYSHAINHFTANYAFLNIGAGAGTDTIADDGLTRFKKGWSTGSRPVYFCGKIFKPEVYSSLVERTQTEGTKYFPAYRNGEF